MFPTRIIWHHSAISSQGSQFDQINDYHMSRNFPISELGFFVGYHYLIEQDGTIKKARNENEIGAHTKGENADSIGICFAGDFNTGKPTEKQCEMAAHLVEGLMSRWGIQLKNIFPHRQFRQTDCPGLKLKDNWIIINYLERKISWLKAILWKLGFKF